MKKILLFLFLLVVSLSYSQSVTTIPVIPTASDAITITFDATGSELDGYTGDVYAHTGVITTSSTSNTDWKHVIGSWGNNATQPLLTRTGANTYQLVISPDIPTYYSSGADVVTDIAVVFRNSTGNAQSRPDIFIPIYAAGLNVTITNPSNESVYSLNDNITISAESSINADLELKVNNVSEQTAINTTTISKSYTFTSTGSFTIEASATENSETKTEQIAVYVKTTTQNETIPTGLENGFNDNGDGTVTFVLQAPLKTDVFLIGGFNNWTLNQNYQMKKDGDTFWLTVNGLDFNTEYAYQYFVDYSLKVADPYSKKILDPNNDQFISNTTYPGLMTYPTGDATGNVSTFKINETAYTWQSNAFVKPNKENLIIYEMLIRDFTETDSFIDAMTHLDYLEQLGVNTIELMPISEFEGNDSWGYNPSFHGALDKAYGTQNHFKSFVDACHSRGIAVIIDVVYNHAFSQSPLAQLYWDSGNNKPAANNPWLNPDAKHPFNVGYDFNHESAYTKTYVKQTLKYWVDEFRVDGFRFDLSKGFTQTNNPSDVGAWGNYDASRITILQDYADYIWNNVSSDAYMILEHFADNSEETVLANYGFMLWGNINHNFNQNTMGYATEADVSWLSYSNRGWTNPHVVGYMESHDEERLMVKNIAYGNSNGGYNVKDLSTALDRQEAASAIFYGIPGPKMLWQFGELGYDKSINCDGDITNGSCRLDRKPVAWTLGYESDSDRMDLYNVTAKMMQLKKQFPSTFNTNNFNLSVGGLGKRINLYDNVGTLDVVIVANFDVTTQSVNPNFPATGTWYDTFSNTSINVTNPTAALSLQPGEYRLYSKTQNLSVKNSDKNNLVKAYPNPTSDSFQINKYVETVSIFDLTGKQVKTFKGSFNKNHTFNISDLSPSIYLAKINSNLDEQTTLKIVKLD
ncbi:alpha-amylase family glycosyl hydrolase [Jejuia spongiicola]|uniref:Alpha-amylase family glycosyl hydrolase n=1 Tax=Jejuia spongiicola TaxID=2942207 RepID=A0ABT0QIF8_9FLAO|nr:alpha-amylase family glycosyl hydrolase [Jejuia spongiicola]MCL6296388.1 alpha-amylase family glycosyl hydrolase [Jejuia spongiicola]